MPTGTRKDPYRSYNFKIELGGTIEGGFQEVSGLDTHTEATEYREGTDPLHARKIPTMNKFTPIMLKRGLTDSKALWEWRDTVVKGKPDRRNGSIIMLDDQGQEVMRWNFNNAWPSKWTGPTFNASGNAIAVEQLELTHEELVLDKK